MNSEAEKASEENAYGKLLQSEKSTTGQTSDGAGDKHEALLEANVMIEDEREMWGNKADFLLSCIGFAVGLGNVWRFPYLCYENGGGAFLFPYLLMLVLCGMPMFYMELAVGQYFRQGPLGVWEAICPLWKGVGFASIVVSFLVCIYYNVIIAWATYFLFQSFRSNVPWKSCNNDWNTKSCWAGRLPDKSQLCNENNTLTNSTNATLALNVSIANSTNATVALNVSTANCTQLLMDPVSPTLEFWQDFVLQMTSGIDEPGVLRWQLVLCLLFCWVIVYFCMWKGVRSSGKVVYFTATFPYVVLLILFVRGVTLPGAGNGILFYLKPKWGKLLEAKVWVAAATQIFYSLGIGFGSLVAFGSYNKFNNNIFRDSIMISLINCGTSIFAGFVIFSTLGFMAYTLNKDIEDVATSGPGLAFVVYPEAIAQMPISPLWAILFFFMILTLGLDSQFGMLEAVITGITDKYPMHLRKRKELFILGACLLCFFIGLSNVTQGGVYVLNLFDYQSGGVSLLFLGFFEAISLAWFYGTGRFSKNIESMTGSRPIIWWKFCWVIGSPVVMLGIFIFSLTQWGGVKYDKYKYPAWAEFVGWMFALSSMLFIPGFAIYQLLTTPGNLLERINFLIKPDYNVQREIEEREGLRQDVELMRA